MASQQRLSDGRRGPAQEYDTGAHFCRLPREIMYLIYDELTRPVHQPEAAEQFVHVRRLAMTCRTWRTYLAPAVWNMISLSDIKTVHEAVRLGAALPGLRRYLKTVNVYISYSYDEAHSDAKLKSAVAAIGPALRHLGGWPGVFDCTVQRIAAAEQVCLQLGSLAELPCFVELSNVECDQTRFSDAVFDSAFRWRSLTTLYLWGCHFGDLEGKVECGIMDTLASTQVQSLQLGCCVLSGRVTCHVPAFANLRHFSFSCEGTTYDGLVNNPLLEATLSRCAGTLTDLALAAHIGIRPLDDADITTKDFLAIACLTRLKGIALSDEWAEERMLRALRHCRAEKMLLWDGTREALAPVLDKPASFGPNWPCLRFVHRSSASWALSKDPEDEDQRAQLYLLRDWNVMQLTECEKASQEKERDLYGW